MSTADLLLTSAHRLSIELHGELEMEGVSTMALLAMRALARSPDARSPRGLAAALGMARSSTTQLLDRLVRDGLVERSVAPENRRARVLALTEHGAATARESAEALDRCMRSFTDAFEEEERAQLSLLLEKLERGADWHRSMRLWRVYDSSSRSARRPPVHIR